MTKWDAIKVVRAANLLRAQGQLMAATGLAGVLQRAGYPTRQETGSDGQTVYVVEFNSEAGK